jgi:hypothetical protein
VQGWRSESASRLIIAASRMIKPAEESAARDRPQAVAHRINEGVDDARRPGREKFLELAEQPLDWIEVGAGGG